MTVQTISVLLVEDNPPDAFLLEEALLQASSSRFTLAVVERLGKALERLSQESFEVVLLDLGLPDSQGLETLLKLRAQVPHVPVVVLTGLVDETLGLSALQAGAQDYLIKGQVEGQEVARIIRYAIERKRSEEEIRRRNRELTLLNEIIAASAAGLEPAAVLDIACRDLALAFDLPRATAILFNEEKTAALVAAEYRAGNQPSAPEFTLPLERLLFSQYALQPGRPLVIDDVQNDTRLGLLHAGLHPGGVVSLLILPLQINGELAGALSLEALEPRSFSVEEINLAWSVADQVGGALARTRLIQTQQRLSAAIEQGNDTVIITDIAGIIIYANPIFERSSGYSRAEAVGQTPRLLKSDQHGVSFYQELWATISAGQVWRGRFTNRRKDGGLYIEEATITPIRNESGTITNYVSVQHDITRELQLEEQYRQAQKMEAVGRLTAGVAHDFNNLLTAINGFTHLIQDQLRPDDPLQEMVATVLRSGERAADLVRQLLAFSRKQVLQPKILDLNEVMSGLEKMLRRLIGEDIDLLVVSGTGLGQIKVDPGQLEQVIMNLVVNALDAMPNGGKLTLETANVELDEVYARDHVGVTPGRFALLAVSDTGTGMEAEVKAHLFEPFFTTKTQGKGTGLGLATVYGIVKQNGGDIQVYSEPGQGATFKIYWPCLEKTEVGIKPRPAHLKSLKGTETVLLAEDEPTVRKMIRQALELNGYTVLEAGQGLEALQLYEAQPLGSIQLLVTDVIMPGGLNGRELAERLQSIHPDLKVLFISGYTDEAIVHHGVLKPGLFFLQKPFTPAILLQKIRQVLEGEPD